MFCKLLNNKKIVIGGAIVALGSCTFIPKLITTSIANSDVVLDMKYVNPYVNYLSMYISPDKLSKVTPSGMNLWEVLYEAEEVYEEASVPLILQDVLVVNKNFGISKDYNKVGIDPEASKMFNEMKLAASEDGLLLDGFSIYRTYDRQVTLYNNYVSRDGKAAADRYSARPGFSEHQTGLAFDICGSDSSKAASVRFNGTPEAEWLKKNAHNYGFVMRFPEDSEDVTGYMHESWHYRYVGVENSNKIYNTGLPIEKYFGLDEISGLKESLPQL